MLVSWKWLSRYVNLDMPQKELEDRFSFSGLNHESSETVGDDVVIDLEVTSNRGDCLGHLGVAREVGVLFDQQVCVPKVELTEGDTAVKSLLSVENRFPDACPRYTARVIQGVKIGPSPAEIADVLESVGIGLVNNVVDITNFVMLECGQPLHAFDYDKIAGQKIVVRPADKDETIEAIDHRQYALDPSMCVIADAEKASAVAGVMGGADSEINEASTNLVIEAADFTPLSVRRTARALKLHSPSSYRFERRVDPAGIDWASRRACQLIAQHAGGTVCNGVLDTAPEIPARPPIVLRLSQVERILGIRIAQTEIQRILTALGCKEDKSTVGESHAFVPPTWRHDLTREADLIEEVARIHGYDKIPENASIPVAPSRARPFDTAVSKVRRVLTSAGISEAMTPSVVTRKLDESISPWTDRPAMQTQTAMLEGSRRLRRSLIPSLLSSRAGNWSASSLHADLFEIAHIYLPSEDDDGLPEETYALGLVRGGDFFQLKGIVESLCSRLGVHGRLTVDVVDCQGIQSGTASKLMIQVDGQSYEIGYMGTVDAATLKSWKLPDPVQVAELSLPVVFELANLVPQQQSISPFPSIQRDLNFVLAESVRWGELETVVRSAVDENLAGVRYVETYRDADKDGPDTKRVLLSVELQSATETLSGQQADTMIQSIVDACDQKLSAKLLQ
ncbi:phenylalanine--tRNA ligase subunit beta [Crateriforma spongiae]|uniref:phenylalanine--tRNA ligase subunit beta n=1 Tax=Crateriforma spongiae TaxID=2724528 RepID=UPI0014460277|nr:phenylalanine--tRNA ligase subunit beta [Crateriforma spongiae]